MIYFISGHRDITDDEFMTHYSHKLLEALRDPNAEFVVGECDGVDAITQHFMIGKTDKLTVYHIGDNPKNNIGDWPTKGGYKNDIHRDSVMTAISDIDIFWIRKWDLNSGTEQNILRRKKIKE